MLKQIELCHWRIWPTNWLFGNVGEDIILLVWDTWHVTRDTLGGWTFSQNFSSLALTVWDLWYYEDILGKGWLNEWINYWMNDKTVCRTASATPGLSNMYSNFPWCHRYIAISWTGRHMVKHQLPVVKTVKTGNLNYLHHNLQSTDIRKCDYHLQWCAAYDGCLAHFR